MKEDLMAALIWIIIVIVVVVVVALVAVGARKRRTAMLRDRFGPEYDRAVENSDDQRAAEADLRDRERQRAQFDVKPLPEADRLRFAGEWRGCRGEDQSTGDRPSARQAGHWCLRPSDVRSTSGHGRSSPVGTRYEQRRSDVMAEHRGTARGRMS